MLGWGYLVFSVLTQSYTIRPLSPFLAIFGQVRSIITTTAAKKGSFAKCVLQEVRSLVLILSIKATCVVKGRLDLVPSFWTLWHVYQLSQPVSKSTSIDTNVMMKDRQCSSLTSGQNVSGVRGLPLKTAPNWPFCSLKVEITRCATTFVGCTHNNLDCLNVWMTQQQ